MSKAAESTGRLGQLSAANGLLVADEVWPYGVSGTDGRDYLVRVSRIGDVDRDTAGDDVDARQGSSSEHLLFPSLVPRQIAGSGDKRPSTAV